MTASQLTRLTELRRALLAFERNTSPRLSPDGRSVVFIRTDHNGQELWLRGADGDERLLAAHHAELLRDLRWTADGSMLLYRHTPRGRELWRLSGIRMAGAERIEIPAPGSVTEYWLSQSDPRAVAYSSRPAGAKRSGLFRVDLGDPGGHPAPIVDNPGFHRWLVDGELRPRGGIRLAEDGSTGIVLAEGSADASAEGRGTARTVLTIDVGASADLAVQRFSRDGSQLFLLASDDATTRRLLAIDSRTARVSPVFQHPRLDVASYPIAGDGAWFDPATGLPDICTVMDQRLRYHALAERQRGPVAHLTAGEEGCAVIVDRSADDRTWLIVQVRDNGPIAYQFFDPVTGRTEPLFVNRPDLAGFELPGLEDFCFTAGDGLELSGFAMRPLGSRGPLPTVVLVHGGPAGRDIWRFHADAQYLASLGYLSLHINYRGSKGFGTRFRLAGNGEWGGTMQQDLYDAVAHGVARGLVDPGRVAFLGTSYGGYASLLAATTRPDLVRCAVAISPPCDLVSFTEKPPPFWQPLSILLRHQVLGHRAGGQLDERALDRRSPRQTLDETCAPLLIAHGVRDPRVPVAEVDRFVAHGRALGTPIRYLRFDDEGHHVKSNVNREILFSEIEDFLEAHLDSDD